MLLVESRTFTCNGFFSKLWIGCKVVSFRWYSFHVYLIIFDGIQCQTIENAKMLYHISYEIMPGYQRSVNVKALLLQHVKYSYVGSDARRREGVIITQCMTIQSTNNNIQVEDTRLRTNVLWLTNQFHKLNLVFRSVFELK